MWQMLIVEAWGSYRVTNLSGCARDFLVFAFKVPHHGNASVPGKPGWWVNSMSSSHPISRREEHFLTQWRAGERLALSSPTALLGKVAVLVTPPSWQDSCFFWICALAQWASWSHASPDYLASPKAKRQSSGLAISFSTLLAHLPSMQGREEWFPGKHDLKQLMRTSLLPVTHPLVPVGPLVSLVSWLQPEGKGNKESESQSPMHLGRPLKVVGRLRFFVWR